MLLLLMYSLQLGDSGRTIRMACALYAIEWLADQCSVTADFVCPYLGRTTTDLHGRGLVGKRQAIPF